ncbi:hypothetical protein D9615_002674 [Tricholomella constricta]|uniref:Uncharacterized protein n=1 Tax=Tricholomella constricta TaxID=117010 RepID=A0A8H5HMZ8_9AGAR|nr:hypothetical protein D9615_002674 [Tricholomella constricta]
MIQLTVVAHGRYVTTHPGGKSPWHLTWALYMILWSRSSLAQTLYIYRCLFAMIFPARRNSLEGRGPGKDGDSDSDSDSDSDTDEEKCRNGVCVVCRKGDCMTSTQGSKPTSSSSTATRTGTGIANVHTSSTGTSTAPSTGITTGRGPGLNNGTLAAKKGLSTGGIVGLVLGLVVLAGLLAMMFLKWRAHRRHALQRPRGSTLLNNIDSSPSGSNATSLHSGGMGSEMSESGFSRGVVASAASTIAAANLAATPPGGYPAPQPYKSFHTGAADGTGPPSPVYAAAGVLPGVTQPRTSHAERQGGQVIETHHSPDVSALASLPSPHEQNSFGVIDGVAVPASGTADRRQSRSLPNVPPSTTHAGMVAFQKELERDHKSNQPGGSRNADVNDPPPVYTD